MVANSAFKQLAAIGWLLNGLIGLHDRFLAAIGCHKWKVGTIRGD